MARRSDHSRAQLAELVLDAARTLASADGLRGVTMRSIAGLIGYAPGSIYNAVGDLDAVLIRLRADTLTRLADMIEALLSDQPNLAPLPRALVVADAYLDFVTSNMRLWSVMFDHRMPETAPLPQSFEQARARPIHIVDTTLTPFFPNPAERRRATTALWAALQGVAALTVAKNLTAADETATPHDIARSLVLRYLSGVEESK